MERLHKKGYISDPVSKAKSVGLSEVGKKRSEELFGQLFGRAFRVQEGSQPLM
jgi:hypothetical protein